ncbi:MAG: LysE family transporter [Microscillaceae bacterium]|nr:LysE family transporter [Microscillaceae bacterium]
MLLDSIFSGVLAGLLLAFVAIGPTFFTLIKVGIQQNFTKGALLASGIVMSDMCILLLVYFGISQIYESLLFKEVFSLIGGVLVFFFGLNSFKKCEMKEGHCLEKENSRFQYIIEGFFLNSLNPFTFGLWLFVIALVNEFRTYTSTEQFVFYATVLLTIFSTDLLKTYIAQQTGRGLSESLLQKIHNFIGVVLILISMRLLYFFIYLIGGGVI